MSEKLLPCPFCGVELYACTYDNGKTRHAHEANGCTLSRKFVQGEEQEKAWNRRAERTRALSQLEAGKVKPLEWSGDEPATFPTYTASGLDRFYVIRTGNAAADGNFSLQIKGVPLRKGGFECLEAAKAAAQADYSQYILSALASPSPAPEAEPVAWQCKKAHWNLHSAEDHGRYEKHLADRFRPLYTTPTPAVDADAVIEAGRLIREAKQGIERADPEILTDTLWMPDDLMMGATVVDALDHALAALSLPPSADKGSETWPS